MKIFAPNALPCAATALCLILLILAPPSVSAENDVIDELNELLTELPRVRAEDRGGKIIVTGWTMDERERAILDRILALNEGVIDLTLPHEADADRMIEVDVIIVTVSETISHGVGHDFLKLVNMRYDFYGSEFNRDGQAFIAPDLMTAVESGSQWSQIYRAGIEYDVNIANADERNVKVIARPHLTTLNGRTAEFQAGGEIVFKVQGIESGDIKPFPFGIQLNVTPTISRRKNSEGETQVLLEVEASRKSVLGRLLSGEGAGSGEDINFDKTMVKTQALLAMDETLCVSGLYQREYRSRDSGVPFLKKIPLIKYFFSNRTEVDDVLSAIIFLTPREPARINQELQEATEDFIERRYRYLKAKAEGGDAVDEFKEDYPDWYKPQPNGYASHLFLVNNSSVYRALRGEDLRGQELRRDLLSVQSASEAREKRGGILGFFGL